MGFFKLVSSCGHRQAIATSTSTPTCPVDGNFLLLRPYHDEHGPKVPVTPEYIVLQRVLRKRECMYILTRMIMHLISI
jgi:hypothetical protein